ncbi:hypothetical protein FPOA_09817 [Fusarium poae]|uniref:Clr5 domain-containing protein n=1 Tax=Fusarium poae TaxID=36050 RepID=A0A1B8ACA0_FUSPO|nr:hypothetical protein FPOA_09817 [Fusarium poae]
MEYVRPPQFFFVVDIKAQQFLNHLQFPPRDHDMSRAPRIPDDQWEVHKDMIKSLYLEQNKTIKEIETLMSENHQFYATEKQYSRKVTVNWQLRKNTKKEEWEQASALVLKRKAEGKPTELTIHGKIIPDKKRKKEIRRYAPKNPSGSPSSTLLETVSARTPPAANRNITYFTIPWFNLQDRISSPDMVYSVLNGTAESTQRSMKSPSPSIQNQVAIKSLVTLLLRTAGDEDALNSDLDATLADVLMLLEKQIPFSHSHYAELQNQQTPIHGPWYRLFLSLAFLSSNNRLPEYALVNFLKLAISRRFLHDLKQALSVQGPTIKLFSVALLFAALDIPGDEGFQLVHYLLQQGVDPNGVHLSGTPLSKALFSQNKATVRLLLDHGADPLASFPSLRLHSALQIESYDMETLAQALLDMRFKISKKITAKEVIFLPTPIFLAVDAGRESQARNLLQAGADPNLFDPEHLSLLHVAIGYRNPQMINLLIEFGADPDFLCRSETTKALVTIHPEMFKPNSLRNQSIYTPLQLAAWKVKPSVVRQLLQAGANPDGIVNLDIASRGESNCHENVVALTALQIASRNMCYEMVEILLESGAGVDTRHALQPTALQYACDVDQKRYLNKMKIVDLLLKWRADVNASPGQENGKSSLEAAAGVADIDLVMMLLSKGAVCSNPASLLKAAFKSGSIECVNFFLDHFSRTGLSVDDKAYDWSQYLGMAAKSRNVQSLNMILNLCVSKSTDLYEKHVIDAMETAVEIESPGILSCLLMSGVNPDADGRACRILSKAIPVIGDYTDLSCFTLLMSKFGAWGLDLDRSLPGDTTPLYTAICCGNTIATQCLIFSGVDIDKPSVAYDRYGEPDENNALEPPILKAIKPSVYLHNDYGTRLVDLLIANGANVDYLVHEHVTALLIALESGKYEVAETLLKHGANPNAKDPKTGMDAFDYILKNSLWPPFSTFKSLIDRGFQVKATSDVGALIRLVARSSERIIGDRNRWDCFAPVVSLLLEAGAELNALPTEKYPMTALQCAVDANHKKLITILLNAGADIHAPAFWKKGKTAVQAACYAGNLELVQKFVAQGVDVNAPPASKYGATALQFTAMQGHLDVAIFLLENGAVINAPAASVEGRTALQGAAEHGRLDMIYLLLENDHDAGLEERCQDAAKFAEKESRFEIAQLLRGYKIL